MSARVAWGAPSFLPTGESSQGELKLSARAWWERNQAEAEVEDIAEEERSEVERERKEKQDLAEGRVPSLRAVGGRHGDDAFYDHQPPRTIEELYAEVPLPVEDGGIKDVQLMAAVVEGGSASSTNSINSMHQHRPPPLPSFPSTSTLTQFSSPQSRASYWLFAVGCSLIILDGELALVATLDVGSSLSSEQRMQVIISHDELESEEEHQRQASANGSDSFQQQNGLKIKSVAANDEEQLAVAIGGSIVVFALELRNRGTGSQVAPSSVLSRSSSSSNISALQLSSRLHSATSPSSSSTLPLNPVAAWDDIDPNSASQSNLPAFDPTRPSEFQLRCIGILAGLRRHAVVAAMGFKTSNVVRTSASRYGQRRRQGAGEMEESVEEGEEDEEDESGGESDDAAADEEEQDDMVGTLARLAKSRMQGSQRSAPLPLRLELVVVSHVGPILVVDCFYFDPIQQVYNRMWSVSGMDGAEIVRRSPLYELASGGSGMGKMQQTANATAHAMSSALIRIAPDGRGLCVAPYGAASCNLYMLNVGSHSVLNVTDLPHSSHIPPVLSGMLGHGLTNQSRVRFGCALQHPQPVVCFHFYASTPSFIERSAIAHPAIAASTHAGLTVSGRPPSYVSLGGFRRPIPSAADPRRLHHDNLLLTLCQDGLVRIWRPATRPPASIASHSPFTLNQTVRAGINIHPSLNPPPMPSAPSSAHPSNGSDSAASSVRGSLSHSTSADDVAALHGHSRSASSATSKQSLDLPTLSAGGVTLQRMPSPQPSSTAELQTSLSFHKQADGVDTDSHLTAEYMDELHNVDWFLSTELESPKPTSASPESSRPPFTGATWLTDMSKHTILDPLNPTDTVASIGCSQDGSDDSVRVADYRSHNPRLLTLDAAGNILIWSLQDIYAEPRRNPRLVTLLQLGTIVSPAAAACAFSRSTWLYAKCSASPLLSKTDSLYTDALLRCTALTCEGQLECVEMVVSRVPGPWQQWAGKAKRIAAIGGHEIQRASRLLQMEREEAEEHAQLSTASALIPLLRSHPCLPLAASLGADGRITLYMLPVAQLVQVSGEQGDRVRFLTTLSADQLPQSSIRSRYLHFIFYPYLLDGDRVLLFALGSSFVDVYQSRYVGERTNTASVWTRVNHATLPSAAHSSVAGQPVSMHVLEPNPDAAFDDRVALAGKKAGVEHIRLVIVRQTTVEILAVPSQYAVNNDNTTTTPSSRSRSRTASSKPEAGSMIRLITSLPLPACTPEAAAAAVSTSSPSSASPFSASYLFNSSSHPSSASHPTSTCTCSFLQRSSRHSTRHMLVYGTSVGHVVLCEIVADKTGNEDAPPFTIKVLNGFEAHRGRRIENLKNMNGLSYLITVAEAQTMPTSASDDSTAASDSSSSLPYFASFSAAARERAVEYDIRVWSSLSAFDTYKPCYDVRHVMPPSIQTEEEGSANSTSASTGMVTHRVSGLAASSAHRGLAGSPTPSTPASNTAARPASRPTLIPFVEALHSLGSGVCAFLTSDQTGRLWIHQPRNLKLIAQKRREERERREAARRAAGPAATLITGDMKPETEPEDFLGRNSWLCQPHPRIFPKNHALLTGTFNASTLGALLVAIPNPLADGGSGTMSHAASLTHIPRTTLPLIRHIHLHPVFIAHRSVPFYHPEHLLEHLYCGHHGRVENILAFILRCIRDQETATSQDENDEASASGLSRLASYSSFGHQSRARSVDIPPMPMQYMLHKEETEPFRVKDSSFAPVGSQNQAASSSASNAADCGQLSGGFGSFGSFGGGGGFGSFGMGNSASTSTFNSTSHLAATPQPYVAPEPERRLDFNDATMEALLEYLTPPTQGPSSSHSHSHSHHSHKPQFYTLAHLSSHEHTQLIRLIRALQSVHTHRKNLDEFGQRYMFAVELLNAERIELSERWAAEQAAEEAAAKASGQADDDARKKQGGKLENPVDRLALTSHAISFAFHSSSSETLLQLTTGSSVTALAAHPETSLTWPYVRSLGLGYWASSESLSDVLLRVARCQFMLRKSPNDCWMWYLALRKKNILLGLMKHLPKYASVYQLMSRDFETDAEAVTAASKNAMRVIERNAELAMGFLLLAASGHTDKTKPNSYLQLALNIAFRRLHDPQLAVAVCRVFEGDQGPTMKRMIEEELLPHVLKPGRADRFLAYMALVMRGRKRGAVNVLIHRYGAAGPEGVDGDDAAARRVPIGQLSLLHDASFAPSTAAFLYLLHCSAPALGSSSSLPHAARHIACLQRVDLYTVQKRSAQRYVERQMGIMAMETFPKNPLKEMEKIEEDRDENEEKEKEKKKTNTKPTSASSSTPSYDAHASGLASFGGGFGGGGGFGSVSVSGSQPSSISSKPAVAVDPAASGQFGGVSGAGGFGSFGSFGSFGGGGSGQAATSSASSSSAAVSANSGQLSGNFGGFGGFGGGSSASSSPSVAATSMSADPQSGQLSGGFGSFGSFGSFGGGGGSTATSSQHPSSSSSSPSLSSSSSSSTQQPKAFNLASFGSFGGGGLNAGAAATTAHDDVPSRESTPIPPLKRFRICPPPVIVLPSSILPMSDAALSTFLLKVRYAFIEVALECSMKNRLDEFVGLVSAGANLAAHAAIRSTTASGREGIQRRPSIIAADADGGGSRASGGESSPTTGVIPSSSMLFALASLHSDFALMRLHFDTFSLLTHPNKLWFKLMNHCFLHRSNMGALICSLYWQQYGDATIKPQTKDRGQSTNHLAVDVPKSVSIPRHLKPLSLISLLRRECTAISALIATRDLFNLLTVGSNDCAQLQYRLAHTYQELLTIREHVNFIFMSLAAQPATGTATGTGSTQLPSASLPSTSPWLNASNDDGPKLEWNLLNSLIHTTLLLWSLELNDSGSILNILDSSFANSQIKHPSLSTQHRMDEAKVDIKGVLPSKPVHIRKNEIPMSSGFNYKVDFRIVDCSTRDYTPYRCVYYHTYSRCARLLQLLRLSQVDPDAGYARSGRYLRVSFLDRLTPKVAAPASAPLAASIPNRILSVEGEDESDGSNAAPAADDYLANPSLVNASPTGSHSGAMDSAASASVRDTFKQLLHCIVLHAILRRFQYNLQRTLMAQVDQMRHTQTTQQMRWIRDNVEKALELLHVSLSAQQVRLHARAHHLMSIACRKLIYAKLDYEYVDLDELEAQSQSHVFIHPSHRAAASTPKKRIFPVQEVVEGALVTTAEFGQTERGIHMPTLIQGLELDRPLQLFADEIVRFVSIESVGGSVAGSEENQQDDATQPSNAAARTSHPFTHLPIDIYKRSGLAASSGLSSGSSGSKSLVIPHGLAVNPCDVRILALATSHGVREINIDHAIKYRQRGKDYSLDDEEEVDYWKALHRFDRMEGGFDTIITADASKNMEASKRIIQAHIENYTLTHLAYPQPKHILAAILNSLYIPGATDSPALLLGQEGTIAFSSIPAVNLVSASASSPLSASSSSFNSGNRVYQDFVSSSNQLSAAAGNIVEREMPATHIAAHPALPLYVSASGPGRLFVWHFGWPAPVAELNTRPSTHSLAAKLASHQHAHAHLHSHTSKPETISSLRFNKQGNKIAATTESGRVLLWVFAAHPLGAPFSASTSDLTSLSPYDIIEAHNKGVTDCVWLGAAGGAAGGAQNNLIATAGEATNGNNVCVWSVVLPSDSRLVACFRCHEKDGGASRLAWCCSSNVLVSAGHKGTHLNVFSCGGSGGSSWNLLRRIDLGKATRLHALTYDPFRDALMAGTADGTFRSWSCSTWLSVCEWTELYPKQSFFQSAGHHHANAGVTDIIANGVDVFCCGGDGSVKYLRSKRHFCINTQFYFPSQLQWSQSAVKLTTPLHHQGQC